MSGGMSQAVHHAAPPLFQQVGVTEMPIAFAAHRSHDGSAS
jgi:hypothetical protein